MGTDSKFEAANVTVYGALEVDGGTVNVTSLATAASGVIVLKGATVNAATLPAGTTIGAGLTTLNYGDADITLGTIVFDEGGMLKLSGTGKVTLSDSTVVPAGTLLVGSGATLSYTGGDLDLNYPVHSVGAGTLTVSLDSGRSITLSSAVSGSVSFDCTGASSLSFGNGFEWTSTGTLTLPDGTVVSKGESYTKMVAQISEMGWSSDGSTIYTTGAHWSGGTGVSNDGTLHFLDYGLQCRTPGDNPLSFPATEKLTIVNGTFTLKSENYTIGNLELCSGAKFDCANDNWTCSVAGAVEISTSSSSPAKFMVDGTCNLNANLSGNGKVLFSQREGDNAKNPAVFKLGGNNGAFFGTIEIGSNTSVGISDANQLGGNPSSRLARGLVLTTGSTVEFTAAFNVNQDNRGLYVDGDGTVTNSALVVWFGPLSFSDGATLTKEGDGELVILGSCSAGRVLLKGLGRAIKFKTAYADIVKVESGLPGYRVVVTAEEDYNAYQLEKVRGLSILVY